MIDVKHGPAEAGLRIGAVAKLTGLSVHTLRKWEDRYHAVSPVRSDGGERLYSHEDVKRLRLMRSLSSAGMSLRELAALELDPLEAAWERVALETPGGAAGPDAGRVARVIAFGATAPGLLEALDSPRIDLVAGAPRATALFRQAENLGADICVCEFSTITVETRGRLDEAHERTGAKGLVVVYGYGARPTVDALRRRGIAFVRAPLDPDALERAVLDVLTEIAGPGPWRAESRAEEDREAPPPPTLTLEAISHAAESSAMVRCECPRHLADVLFGLRAFEEYSADCESRNPQDAALHRYLWTTAGRARAMFEEALARVAKAEGIALD